MILSASDAKLCRQMVEDGKSSREIGLALNKPRGSVIRYCKNNNLVLAWNKKQEARKLTAKSPVATRAISAPKQINNSPRLIPEKHGAFKTCQWIYSDPRERVFCQKDATHGSWCENHYRLTHLVAA